MADNLQDLRIPDNAFNDNDVKNLEDVPSMSAADLKAVFDYGAEKIVTPALNALIAFLASSKAAGALGITGIDGVGGASVQGLLESMKTLIDDRYTKEQSDRLLDLKLNQSTANGMVKDVKIDLATGVIRVEKLDGSFEETDTALEKIAVNVTFDRENQRLVLTLPDGNTETVDISDFVKTDEFIDGDAIGWSRSGGTVTAHIKSESITMDLLAPALLADFTDKVQKAADGATNAKASEENAKTYMETALAYRDEAKQSAYEAAIAKNYAETSETNAKTSETNAKTSETNAAESAKAAAESAEKAKEIAGGDFATKTEFNAHTGDKNNPHGVTAKQVGADTAGAAASAVAVHDGSINAHSELLKTLKTKAHKIKLTAAGWSDKTQTVSVADVLEDETAQLILPMPTMANKTAYDDAGIQCAGQAAGKLTFTCETAPTADIEVFATITPTLFS